MRIIYLKNFRKGYATNSSSTHSIIYRNKDEMFEDLNIFELDFYDRFDNTIAASREGKIKYIAANIFFNKKLFEIMCLYYPEMKQYEEKAKYITENTLKVLNNEITYDDFYEKKFGMYDRGALYFSNSKNLEANIDYLRNIIDNDDIIIVGGSDEGDFVYYTIENHKELPKPEEIDLYRTKGKGIFKNGNYWVGYGSYKGGRLRFATTNHNCIPSYPELIDLKITNKCNNNCKFCYMDSNKDGQHADLNFLKRIINKISTNDFDTYDKRIEFSIGGGDILLYPQLEELFSFITKQGHIVNTTINAKDAPKVAEDKKLFGIFKNYVKGIGVSVNNEEDIPKILQLRNKLTAKNNDFKQITIHIIPELLGTEKTIELIKKVKSHNFYSILLLGYKTNGRGKTQNHSDFTDDELEQIFDGNYSINVDTTFANKYYNWLKDNFETEHTLTLNEGEYSMYIDGVTKKAYKSSYQLDKPYNIEPKEWQNENKTWFTITQAFNNIRKDNGFEIYKPT